jgi:hypothetical protein
MHAREAWSGNLRRDGVRLEVAVALAGCEGESLEISRRDDGARRCAPAIERGIAAGVVHRGERDAHCGIKLIAQCGLHVAHDELDADRDEYRTEPKRNARDRRRLPPKRAARGLDPLECDEPEDDRD